MVIVGDWWRLPPGRSRGEILTEAALGARVAGLIIDGAVRDIDAIEALRFPVFSRGLAIGACTKEKRVCCRHRCSSVA